MLPDHYATLGVDRSADARTIRAAYLRVMRQHHPDQRPGDPHAAEVARRANAAYAVLRNPAARRSYDRQHSVGGAVPFTGRVSAVERPAYSPDHRAYRRTVTRALGRIVAALFVVAVLMLAALG